jgi:FMN-dependent oxidoreductase (nitrilotriacetate monooxygenase family)
MTVREASRRKQIQLGAHFPGVNNTTVWSDPSAGSQIAFESFVHLAKSAERGLFDFFFLAEGLRLREHRGKIHDLDIVGRPDTFTVLAALAAVTDNLGLSGTINTTFNEPYEVARQFATLDHLSDGRSAWNMVTSSDAFTGENFRRGGFLAHADRYHRAEEFITVARRFWDSWAPEAVVADVDADVYADPKRIGSIERDGRQFGVRGVASLPAGPQGHPVLLQAGDSDDGRDFGAKHADALFTLHGSLEAGQRYYADVKSRAAAYGRDPNQLKVLPGATFALGDTPAEAHDNARYIREQQVSGPTAIAFLEQVWRRGPFGLRSRRAPARRRARREPEHHPRAGPARRPQEGRRYVARPSGSRTPVDPRADHRSDQPPAVRRDSGAGGRRDRSLCAVGCLRRLHSGAAPDAACLDEFVDKVVPLLQERGSFRTEYRGHTLREHLGLLPTPGRTGHPADIGNLESRRATG